jgi:predicted acylesterase/phospholipase RssA
MNKIAFQRFGNTFISRIQFHGREIPLRCKLTDGQIPYSESILKNLARRWERIPVQRRQLKKFGIDKDAVKVINIDSNLPPESELFVNGVLNYSFPKAMRVRGDLTGLGLSGGGAKSLSELGVVSIICSALAIKPDVISGTSGGSIVASVLAFNPDPDRVIKMVYQLVQKYSAMDLLDINLSGFGDFGNFTGLMKGKKIIDIITREFGLFGKMFSQTVKQLFIPTTDLNSGKGMVFCDPSRAFDALIEDPREPESGIDEKIVPNLFPEDSLVMDAVAKSIRVPAIFTVLPMDHGGVSYDFSDGGELDNNASRMLISCIDVGKIIMVDLGYSNQLKGRFRNKNLFEALFQAIDVMGSVQREALNGPLCKEDLSIRVINPGLFGVGSLESYSRAQDIILSARGTAQHIISALSQFPSNNTDPHVLRSRFYSDWDPQMIKTLRGEKSGDKRMSIKRWGGPGSNVYYLMDKRPTINQPEVLDSIKAVEGTITTKTPGIFDEVKFYSNIFASFVIGAPIKYLFSLLRKREHERVSQTR